MGIWLGGRNSQTKALGLDLLSSSGPTSEIWAVPIVLLELQAGEQLAQEADIQVISSKFVEELESPTSLFVLLIPVHAAGFLQRQECGSLDCDSHVRKLGGIAGR